ncbi:O-methyltransferase [Hirsutella rhossiliensis]|uniref:O-methyltransferase n=1 Tax=Hirsutella rhossiliensis TaxID=111463 RepID=A0A9P8MZL1_9HYPO|nr:O-methyltransferase [Hirsutella rhossiliensis]KAH0964202.1 O-methyltransferase [Hirsutella rhossiliensis]
MSNGFIKFDPTLVDEDRGQDLLILCTVFSILIVLSTGSRVVMKLVTKVGLGTADYFIIIALAFNLTANILEIQAVQHGFGRHLQFIDRPHVLTLKRLSQYNILFANISLWAVKISICFFILAIVQNVHRRTKWVIYGLIAITTTASTCQGILWGLQAKPLRKLWEPDIPGEVASISTLVHSIIAFTAINSLTDLFYAVAPVYFFGRLQMSLARRLVVIGLTGSGLFVFASSIIRVAFDGDFYNPDFTWALYRVYLCTVIERNMAEVIADLPASFTLLRGVQKKTQTLLSRGTRNSTKVSNMSGHSAGDKSFHARASSKRGAQYSNL